MTTGRIDYAPDYRLITEVVFRCPNCGNPDCAEAEDFRAKVVKETTERARLERAICDAAKAEYEAEYAADRGANTITRTDALITLQPLMQKRRDAVAALFKFEAENK